MPANYAFIPLQPAGYAHHLPDAQRRNLLVKVYNEQTRYTKSALIWRDIRLSLLNLWRLNRRKEPDHAAVYLADANWVAQHKEPAGGYSSAPPPPSPPPSSPSSPSSAEPDESASPPSEDDSDDDDLEQHLGSSPPPAQPSHPAPASPRPSPPASPSPASPSPADDEDDLEAHLHGEREQHDAPEEDDASAPWRLLNYYELLGVDRKATVQEINAAYRKAAKRAHPDRNGGRDGEFKRMQQAVEVLRNPVARAEYDRVLFGRPHSAKNLFNAPAAAPASAPAPAQPSAPAGESETRVKLSAFQKLVYEQLLQEQGRERANAYLLHIHAVNQQHPPSAPLPDVELGLHSEPGYYQYDSDDDLDAAISELQSILVDLPAEAKQQVVELEAMEMEIEQLEQKQAEYIAQHGSPPETSKAPRKPVTAIDFYNTRREQLEKLRHDSRQLQVQIRRQLRTEAQLVQDAMDVDSQASAYPQYQWTGQPGHRRPVKDKDFRHVARERLEQLRAADRARRLALLRAKADEDVAEMEVQFPNLKWVGAGSNRRPLKQKDWVHVRDAALVALREKERARIIAERRKIQALPFYEELFPEVEPEPAAEPAAMPEQDSDVEIDEARTQPPHPATRFAVGQFIPPTEVIRQVGDGNCFFRSIAYAVYGDASQHLRVREEVVEWGRAHPAVVNAWVDGADATHHLSLMARPGRWATELEAFITGELYSINLEVFQAAVERGGYRLTGFVRSTNYLENPTRTVWLVNPPDHYDILAVSPPPPMPSEPALPEAQKLPAKQPHFTVPAQPPKPVPAHDATPIFEDGDVKEETVHYERPKPARKPAKQPHFTIPAQPSKPAPEPTPEPQQPEAEPSPPEAGSATFDDDDLEALLDPVHVEPLPPEPEPDAFEVLPPGHQYDLRPRPDDLSQKYQDGGNGGKTKEPRKRRAQDDDDLEAAEPPSSKRARQTTARPKRKANPDDLESALEQTAPRRSDRLAKKSRPNYRE